SVVFSAALGEIAGAEPAIVGEGGTRRRVIPVVAGESKRAAHLELAVLADAHLRPRARPSRGRCRDSDAVTRARVKAGLQLGHAPELRHGAAGHFVLEMMQ